MEPMERKMTPGKSFLIFLSLAFFISLLFPSSLLGDVVILRDGRKLEGKIIEETKDYIVLEMKFGTQKFSRSEVKEIEKKETPTEIFKEKYEETDKNDVDALLDLAEWCKENKLFAEMKKVYTRVLRVDPDNKVAHSALGHVEYKGKWYSKKEIERVKEMEMRDKGLVKYKGKWVTREEKEAMEKGLVKVGDQWLTPDEAKREAGFVKDRSGEWITPEEKERRNTIYDLEECLGIRPENLAACLSKNFIVRGHTTQETAEKISKLAEEILEYHAQVFKLARPTFWMGRGHIFLFDEHDSYEEFLNTDLCKQFFKDVRFRKLLAGGSRGGVSSAPPTICDAKAENVPYEPRVMHQVSHLCLTYFTATKDPDWLKEGLGNFVEHKFYGKALTHCTTLTNYGDKGEIADKNKSSDMWKPLIKESVETQTDTCFEKLMKVELNQLDYEHLSKSWSIVTFLMENHQEEFVKFLRLLVNLKQEDALEKAFGWKSHGFNPEDPSASPPHDLDAAWRKWVLETY